MFPKMWSELSGHFTNFAVWIDWKINFIEKTFFSCWFFLCVRDFWYYSIHWGVENGEMSKVAEESIVFDKYLNSSGRNNAFLSNVISYVTFEIVDVRYR